MFQSELCCGLGERGFVLAPRNTSLRDDVFAPSLASPAPLLPSRESCALSHAASVVRAALLLSCRHPRDDRIGQGLSSLALPGHTQAPWVPPRRAARVVLLRRTSPASTSRRCSSLAASRRGRACTVPSLGQRAKLSTRSWRLSKTQLASSTSVRPGTVAPAVAPSPASRLCRPCVLDLCGWN
jgi:hypothetical protein